MSSLSPAALRRLGYFIYFINLYYLIIFAQSKLLSTSLLSYKRELVGLQASFQILVRKIFKSLF